MTLSREDFEEFQELCDTLENLVERSEHLLRNCSQHERDRSKAYWLGNLKEAAGQGFSPLTMREFLEEVDPGDDEEDEDSEEEEESEEGTTVPEVISFLHKKKKHMRFWLSTFNKLKAPEEEILASLRDLTLQGKLIERWIVSTENGRVVWRDVPTNYEKARKMHEDWEELTTEADPIARDEDGKALYELEFEPVVEEWK